MTSRADIPEAIGPWQIQGLIFEEEFRRCFRARARSLSADIMVLDVPGSRVGSLDADVTRSQAIVSYEIPKVLDAELARAPMWIASDDSEGTLLGTTLEESGPLSPSAWAELAKTALIGCAALRSVGVRNFQISPQTFTVTADDIHMCNYWAAKLEPSPFTPPGKTSIAELGPSDDKFAIGKLLQLAMGLSPARPIGDEQTLPVGYTQEHIAFIRQLTSTEPTSGMSTEFALRAIPGRDPRWTVPIFALDQAWKPRMQRRAQRIAIWAMAISVALTAVFLAARWIGGSWGSESVSPAGPEGTSGSDQPGTPTRIIRIRSFNGEFPEETLTNASVYQLAFCIENTNLDLGRKATKPSLNELRDGDWERISRNVVVTGGRPCRDKEARVTLQAVASTAVRATEDWSPCQSMQVSIPREGERKPELIEYCVEQRTEYR